jgi:hypothetical protein
MMSMEPSTLPALAALGRDASLTPARITTLFDDGRVQIDAGDARVCQVLCASGVPYLLAPGDEVLAWLPNDASAGGIVLGRVGPSRAASAGPDEPPAELVLEARSALTLRVGDGSIEIRADGKILIKGSDLVSHATRVNRIKGGAVAIN